MTITIKEKDNGAITYFTTVSPNDSGDKLTGSFFDQSSFDLTTVPKWVTNYSSSRNGGYKHFINTQDGKLNALLHLTGTTRFADLQTWRNIAGGTVFYFNSDVDSNLDGNYVIVTSLKPKYFPNQRRIELKMIWEEHNNA